MPRTALALAAATLLAGLPAAAPAMGFGIEPLPVLTFPAPAPQPATRACTAPQRCTPTR